MKFTFNWLKEFIAVDADPEELAGLLTMAGLEVESVTRCGRRKPMKTTGYSRSASRRIAAIA